MKKFLCCLMLVILTSASASAQFEKDKWYLNASLTGLDLSNNDQTGTRLGFSLGGGAFVADNVMILVHAKGDYVEHAANQLTLGAGARYYFSSCGIYGGLGFSYKHAFHDDFGCMTPEVGYVYFLNRHLTIEPAVYYDMSFKNMSDYNTFGFKLGLGFFF